MGTNEVKADKMDTLDRLQMHVDLHLLFGIPKDHTEAIRFLAFALAGEAGELTGPLKKQWRGDNLDPTEVRAKVIDELADVANYCSMLARQLGVDLQAEQIKKFRIVETRPAFLEQMRRRAAADATGAFKTILKEQFGIDLDQ